MAKPTGDKPVAELTIDKYMEKQRTQLAKEKEVLLAERAKLDEQIITIDRQLIGFNAYERAIEGKLTLDEPKPRRTGGGPGSRGTRKGSLRQTIVDVLANHPAGLARGELFEQMGIKQDDAKAGTVSTSLTSLKKAGKIKKDGEKWMAVA